MTVMGVWILVATVAGHVAVVQTQAPNNSTETGEGAAVRTLQHPRTPVHGQVIEANPVQPVRCAAEDRGLNATFPAGVAAVPPGYCGLAGNNHVRGDCTHAVAIGGGGVLAECCAINFTDAHWVVASGQCSWITGNRSNAHVGVGVGPPPCSSNCSYDWTSGLPLMPTARHDLAVGVVGTTLYAVGGSGEMGNVGTLEAFDTVTKVWTSGLPAMPTARANLALGVVGATLYAVGGSSGNGDTVGTLEAFDTATKTWSTGLPAMPTARESLAVGVVGTTLYAVGGSDISYAVVGTVEAFDTATTTWSNGLPAMPTARFGLAAGVVGTMLYAVGGDDNGNAHVGTVEAFDTATKTWSMNLPAMPTARYWLAVEVVGTTLYAVGGYGTSNYLGTVEAFDTATKTWSKGLPAMPTARSGLAVGVVDTTLYTVGGFDVNSNIVGTLEALTVQYGQFVCVKGACVESNDGKGVSRTICERSCKCPLPFASPECNMCANPHYNNVTSECTDCTGDFFGKDCKQPCTCQHGLHSHVGHGNNSGIAGNGTCLGGCESGWAGDNCDDCDAAHFGPACAEPCYTCVHGTNSSGIHGTGACTKCEAPFTGLECNLCHGTHDDPQCGTAYQPANCLDSINGDKIRAGCPSMCNACGPPLSPPGPSPPAEELPSWVLPARVAAVGLLVLVLALVLRETLRRPTYAPLEQRGAYTLIRPVNHPLCSRSTCLEMAPKSVIWDMFRIPAPKGAGCETCLEFRMQFKPHLICFPR